MRNHFPQFFTKNLGTFLTIFVIFIHSVVLSKKLECTCNEQNLSCLLYMTLPFFILSFLQFWMDRVCYRMCTCKPADCFILLYYVSKAAFIGLLWVVFVLLDGDWFVCCWNSYHGRHSDSPCKNQTDIKQRNAELKNSSMILGLVIILCAIFVASLSASCVPKQCCWYSRDWRRNRFHKQILDMEEHVLTDILKQTAREMLTEGIMDKIRGQRWEDCFNVAKEMIDNNASPEGENIELRDLSTNPD